MNKAVTTIHNIVRNWQIKGHTRQKGEYEIMLGIPVNILHENCLLYKILEDSPGTELKESSVQRALEDF